MVEGFVPAPDPAGWPWTGPDLQHQHLHPEKKKKRNVISEDVLTQRLI